MISVKSKATATTTQLLQEIEYKEAGVRRKLIAKDEQLQAVLVCLPAGTCLSSQNSAHNGFITILEGQGTFLLEDKEIRLTTGTFVVLPVNTIHAVNIFTNLAFLKVVVSHGNCQQFSH